jgi:hypothetical protein
VSNLYPARSTYHETFARVVPNTGQEAKALVAEMQALHVTHLYVTDDGQPYSAAIATEVVQAAKTAGLTETPGAATEAAVQASGADAVFYGGTLDSPGAARSAQALLDSVSASKSAIKLFAPSGLYNDTFVSGLTAATQARLVISSPGFLTHDLSSQGQQFVSEFKSHYGHDPAPQAIFGYAAMQAVLTVLDDAGAQAGNRADVVARFRTLKTDQTEQSVLGPYSITGGDPSIAPFVFARSQHGKLVPFAKG